MRNVGRFLVVGALALGGFAGSAGANHGEQGKKLQMSDLPQAVSSTFQAEAEGGQIQELRSVTRNGKQIYEGEVVKNGKGTDLQVSQDGTVLKRGGIHDEAAEHER